MNKLLSFPSFIWLILTWVSSIPVAVYIHLSEEYIYTHPVRSFSMLIGGLAIFVIGGNTLLGRASHKSRSAQLVCMAFTFLPAMGVGLLTFLLFKWGFVAAPST
jgi:hypothetical protein